MADWGNPSLSSTYTDFLNYLKDRDADLAKLFDGTGTNVPAGTIRWNSANNRYEKFDGTSWDALSSQYSINVTSLVGRVVNDNASGTGALWTAAKVQAELNNKATTALSNVSNSTVLNKVKAVDGAGSGLDADTLDGIQGSTYVRKDQNNSMNGRLTWSTSYTGGWGGRDGDAAISLYNSDITGINSLVFSDIADSSNEGLVFPVTSSPSAEGDYCSIVGASDRNFYIYPDVSSSTKHKVWHAGNDGAGSGLDADTVDGLQASQFLRSDVDDTATGLVSFTKGIDTLAINDTSNQQLVMCAGEATIDSSQTDEMVYINAEGGFQVAASPDNWQSGYAGTVKTIINHTGIKFNGNTVWHAGNDGAGSGLDADTVDGLQASQFLRSDADDTVGGVITFNNDLCFTDSSKWIAKTAPSGWGLYWATDDNKQYASNMDDPNPNEIVFVGDGHYKSSVALNDGTIHTKGNIQIDNGAKQLQIGNISGDNYLSLYQTTSDDYGFTYQNSNVSALVNEEGAINEALVLGDSTDANTLFGISISQDSGDTWSKRLNLTGEGDLYVGTTGEHKVWHAGNDGAGSGLDADTVDGLQASQFLRSDTPNTHSQLLAEENPLSSSGFTITLHTATDSVSTTVSAPENSIGASAINEDLSTEGHFDLDAGEYVVLARGIWMLSAVNNGFHIDVYSEGDWRGNDNSYSDAGGTCVISDGGNVRIRNVDTHSCAVFYRRLSD